VTIQEFVKDALKVPFREKGRDFSGWDCWAVPYVSYREVLGKELPDYLDEYPDPGNSPGSRKILNKLIDEQKRQWAEVKDGRYMPLDVALFTLGGGLLHVGMMINRREFLHCEKTVGTVIERLNSVMWAKRLKGVYRCLA
jgi:cell wall-associated NlpC family hydrolase